MWFKSLQKKTKSRGEKRVSDKNIFSIELSFAISSFSCRIFFNLFHERGAAVGRKGAEEAEKKYIKKALWDENLF